jgi:hypothetical protein
MAMERGAEPTDVATQVQRLASLWRAVTSLPMHPAGCTCMGHFLIPALNARDMEADILDYMRGRYAAEGVGALVALLDSREAEREADTPLTPFRTWLLRLPEAGIPGAALERFVTDLTDTLESFGSDSRPSGSGSGIICT